jgi:hypothetical protein
MFVALFKVEGKLARQRGWNGVKIACSTKRGHTNLENVTHHTTYEETIQLQISMPH